MKVVSAVLRPNASTVIRSTFAIAIGVLVLGAPATASAQSGLCLQLANEIRAIDSGGGFAANNPQVQQYARAIEDQRAQIARTERAARVNGCGGFSLFRQNATLCQRISGSLEQMYANLRKLQDTRARLAPANGNSVKRARLVREMQRFNCRVQATDNRRASTVRQTPQRRSLLEQIFGVRTYGDNGRRSGMDFDPDTGLSSRYGTFRTLCVRSCDGYYFPISFSTVSERFGQDDQTCQSMCPGAQVELYYHGMPNQDSEDMVSVAANVPYSELPNAFNYREKFDPECSCRSNTGNLREIAGSSDFITEEQARTATVATTRPPVGIPVFRPDPGLDPETSANQAGGLTVETLLALAEGPDERDQQTISQEGGKRVRIVGPAFFPVQ